MQNDLVADTKGTLYQDSIVSSFAEANLMGQRSASGWQRDMRKQGVIPRTRNQGRPKGHTCLAFGHNDQATQL